MRKMLAALIIAMTATGAQAFTTTTCTQTYGGGTRCVTTGGGTYTTTTCTPTFGGGVRCTQW